MIRFLMCFSGLICWFFLIANSWAIDVSNLEGKKGQIGRMSDGIVHGIIITPDGIQYDIEDIKNFFKKSRDIFVPKYGN